MDTTNHTPHIPSPAASGPALSDRIRHSKALIPTLAVLLVAVAAMAATLVTGRSGAEGDPRGVAQTTPQPDVVRAPPLKSTQQFAAGPQAEQPSSTRSLPARQPDTRAMGNGAATCVTCGVVESSVAVQRKVPVQGIGNTQITAGAVAGGVIGGLLGNQVGSGNGRAAATVLGAAGGAYAGNEVQKSMNKVTVYQVRVRMNDGSVRTIEQSHPVAAGARVAVNNGALRLL